MAIQFTERQTRVLQARKHNILVSAAAGSGKTAVLVERIVRMISEGEDPMDIDRLLVVTFTKAAAAQMRERIGAAIAARIEEEPDNVHLQRQETLLHNAQITTMDSFFTFLLRNNFSDIDMDPGFRQMDQTEADLMRKDAMDDFLEEGYADGDPSLKICEEYFCRDSGDRELEDILESLYKQAVSHPDPGEWLRDRALDYTVESEEELYASHWMQFIILTVAEKIADMKRQYERLLEYCAQSDGPAFYIPSVREDLEIVSALGEVPSAEEAGEIPADEIRELWSRVLDILRTKFESLPRFNKNKYKEVDPDKKDTAKALIDKIRGTVEKLDEKYRNESEEQILAIMEQMRSAAQALSDLTGKFLQYFAQVKKEKNVIDFVDLEHLALQILTEKGKDGVYRPRRAAMAYRQYFDEILIDEYQDSNDVQELLLKMISTEDEGAYNRFMVGDVKQSIYKFRLARPEIFMAKMGDYRHMDDQKERIDLDSNFRSRAEVLDSVNEVFFRIMRREIGGVEYDDEVSLKTGASYPDVKDPGAYKTELIVLQGPDSKEAGEVPEEISELSNRQKEALAVSGRIKELVGTLQVKAEDGGLRSCRYGDIVVLLRSGKGWNEDFRDVFERQGIPYYIESKTGYFSASEIQSVLEMVRVLDNPMQDIPLYGVLRGYWGGFTEEEIAQIRLTGNDRDTRLYTCLLRKAEEDPQDGSALLPEKCRRFLQFLGGWRDKVIYMQIRELLTELVTRTGYEEWCRALPGGEQRSANLQLLLAQAAAYDSMGLRGLFDFVRYIDQVHHREVDYGEANILDENADVVRIMSIHKSKGLEFPVCIVAGMGKQHSYKNHDTKGTFICDNDWGIGMDGWDPGVRAKYSTIRKEAVADKIRRESLGEELRVLYVAMTRAKEKLILTGYVKNGAKKCDSWEKQTPGSMEHGEKLPIPLISESESYLELLRYAVNSAEHPEYFAVTEVPEKDLVWNEAEQQKEYGLRRQEIDKAAEAGGAPLPDQALAAGLERIYSRRYAHENLRGLYTKTSVSELKIASLEEEEGEGAYELFPENRPSPVIASFAVSGILPREEAPQEGIQGASGEASGPSGFSGTEYGTAVHRLLELFDYRRFSAPSAVSRKELDEWREELAASGRIPASYADQLPVSGIMAFLGSGLAARMAKAASRGELFREQPFVLGIEASRVNPSFPEEETMLVQGIIDAYFEEEGELVLVDYKTDRVSEEQELTDRYKVQLDLYERALEQITGKKVKEKLIYSVSLRKTVRL